MARQLKDSGIEWIGEIPADWKLKRLKWILAERKEKTTRKRPILFSRLEQHMV